MDELCILHYHAETFTEEARALGKRCKLYTDTVIQTCRLAARQLRTLADMLLTRSEKNIQRFSQFSLSHS